MRQGRTPFIRFAAPSCAQHCEHSAVMCCTLTASLPHCLMPIPLVQTLVVVGFGTSAHSNLMPLRMLGLAWAVTLAAQPKSVYDNNIARILVATMIQENGGAVLRSRSGRRCLRNVQIVRGLHCFSVLAFQRCACLWPAAQQEWSEPQSLGCLRHVFQQSLWKADIGSAGRIAGCDLRLSKHTMMTER